MKKNDLFADKTLKSLVNSVKISEEDKKALIEKIPEMNEEERRELFVTMEDIYLLDREEIEAVRKIEEYKKTAGKEDDE